jgi:type I restriction enzyme S subunit
MSLMKIKDLFHFEKGSLQSTKATPGEYDFITAAANWKTHNEFTHDCEALIFAAAASGSLGRTHFVNGKFISSDLCFIITPKDPDKYPIDLKFYHLIFLAFKDEIVRNTKSGTSKEAIGLTVFGKYELPYFDIEKQIETREQFVNAQESSNKLDSELSHQLDLVKQIRKAFLREALQGKLVQQNENNQVASILLEKIKAEKERLIKEEKIKKPKPLPPINENDIPFDIPKSWSWCKLGDLFEIVRGSSPRPKGDPRYWSKERTPYHWITIADFTPHSLNEKLLDSSGFLTEAGSKKSRVVKSGDLLIACSGVGSVGRSIQTSIDGFIYDGLLAIRNIQNDILKEFVQHFLKYKEEQIYSVASGANWLNINIEVLSNYILPLPPLAEIEHVVDKLQQVNHYCDELEVSIQGSLLKNYLLLKQVLTEALGLKIQKEEPQKKISKTEQRTSKFDPNSTLMEIVELLKKHGKLHAEELWKMSKYPDDIDAFYAELKKQIELNNTVKESAEKGYLELA